MDEIKVLVTKYSNRKFYTMYYIDPLTEKMERKSTKETTKTKADRAAGKWQAEINSGIYRKTCNLSWSEFVEKHNDEVLPKLSDGNAGIREAVFKHLESYCNPKTVQRVATTRVMSGFQKWLRDQRSESDPKKPRFSVSTIASYLAHLRTTFNWAVRQKFIREAPVFEMPELPTGKLMKGRPLSDAEFQTMLNTVPDVRKYDAEIWKDFLRGLWLSGLRLSEGLRLSWDADSTFRIHLGSMYPQFAIEGAQKNGEYQYLPMARDFWEFISKTPEEDRTGFVLPLPSQSSKTGAQLSETRACRKISEIGTKAGIVTDAVKGSHASAHDLRRSFGSRWSKIVGEDQLKQMMRHKLIETTRRYYAEIDADNVSMQIWNMAEDAAKSQLKEGEKTENMRT